MKWSSLKNRSVISLAGAEKIGFVDDLLLDAAGKTVLALRVRAGGLLTHRLVVLLTNVEAVGEDAVTVKDSSRLNKEESFSDLTGSVQASQITGSRMMTEDGQEIGTIGDIDVNVVTGVVSDYFLSVSLLDRLRGDTHPIPVSAVTSLGDNIVIVANDIVSPGS